MSTDNYVTKYTETLEIPLTDSYTPRIIQLSSLFGALELHFHAQTESYGVVDIDALSEDGELCLSAGEFANRGDTTRIAIRATEPEGDAIVMIITARIADLRQFPNIAQVA